MALEMGGIIEAGRDIGRFRKRETIRSAVTQAGNRTIEASTGHLNPEEPSFYENLLGSVNGASARQSRRELRLTISVALAVTFLTSCAPGVLDPVIEVETATPTPTLVAPTETPTPRATSTPTTEPSPTIEPIPGIDTPVEAEGVRLTFTDATVTDEFYAYDGSRYYPFPGSGYRYLVIGGSYSGDFSKLFAKEGGVFYGNKNLNVEGREWPSYRNAIFDWTQGKFHLVFHVREGDEGPFIIHDTVHGWDVALTPVMQSSP